MGEQQRSVESRRGDTDRRVSMLSYELLNYANPDRRSGLDRRSEEDRRMGNWLEFISYPTPNHISPVISLCILMFKFYWTSWYVIGPFIMFKLWVGCIDICRERGKAHTPLGGSRRYYILMNACALFFTSPYETCLRQFIVSYTLNTTLSIP